MEVVKIRGSYRVTDENGRSFRYTEEEYNALYGDKKDVVEKEEVKEDEVVPFTESDPFSLKNV